MGLLNTLRQLKTAQARSFEEFMTLLQQRNCNRVKGILFATNGSRLHMPVSPGVISTCGDFTYGGYFVGQKGNNPPYGSIITDEPRNLVVFSETYGDCSSRSEDLLGQDERQRIAGRGLYTVTSRLIQLSQELPGMRVILYEPGDYLEVGDFMRYHRFYQQRNLELCA